MCKNILDIFIQKSMVLCRHEFGSTEQQYRGERTLLYKEAPHNDFTFLCPLSILIPYFYNNVCPGVNVV